jgi:hypothetical protein
MSANLDSGASPVKRPLLLIVRCRQRLALVFYLVFYTQAQGLGPVIYTSYAVGTPPKNWNW